MVYKSGEGHIPSSFSIVDIIDHLYGKVLNVKSAAAICKTRAFRFIFK